MKRALGCEVIASNQTGPSPSYPYVSFTVTTPVVSDGKGWARDRDGREFKDLAQIWSFTVQSEDPFQAAQIALDAYEWLSTESGNLYLAERGIVVQGLGNIGNRDNLLSIQYEYREGFDVTFLLRHTSKETVFDVAGAIETIEFNLSLIHI